MQIDKTTFDREEEVQTAADVQHFNARLWFGALLVEVMLDAIRATKDQRGNHNKRWQRVVPVLFSLIGNLFPISSRDLNSINIAIQEALNDQMEDCPHHRHCEFIWISIPHVIE